MIAHTSEYFCNAIKNALPEDFEVVCCQNSHTALQALSSFRPDALILDLMLPCKDGMSVLRETAYKPDIILGLTSYSTDYIAKAAAREGIGYLLVSPTVRTVISRIEDMLYCMSDQPTPRELQIVCNHMQRLGLCAKLDGYKQLRVGIPMFRRDTRQMLLNELYPAIAETYDWHDPEKWNTLCAGPSTPHGRNGIIVFGQSISPPTITAISPALPTKNLSVAWLSF